MMFALLQTLMYTNTIYLSGVCLLFKFSLKAVLLHNGNKFPTVPLAHAANMKGVYENMKVLFKKIQYEKYNWNICWDLMVITLLLGLQLGYTAFCCFVCG
jgi:hypothetical protein